MKRYSVGNILCGWCLLIFLNVFFVYLQIISFRRNVNVIPDSDEEISNEEDTPSSSVERTLSSTRTSISSSRRGAASTVSAAKTTTRGGRLLVLLHRNRHMIFE